MMPDEYKIRGYEIVRKEVKKAGNSGQIYLPQKWIGELVAVVRLGRAYGESERGTKYEIWSVDPCEKICDCVDEYDAISRSELLQQLEPEKEFSIREYSFHLNEEALE